MKPELGISGIIARKFLHSEITPLLALVGLLLGLFAVLVTPREEEPQIDVTFANVFIPFPGASVADVEQLVTGPAEQVMSEIDGVKNIYSVSRPGMSVLTVRFEVGRDRTQSIVQLYNAVFSNGDWLPPDLGVGQPLIKPKGIDDVPIVTGTLWTDDPNRGAAELAKVAHAIETELKRVPGTRDIFTIGAPQPVVQVALDPQRLAGFGLAVDDLRLALKMGNRSGKAGALVNGDQRIEIQAGTFLSSSDEVADLIVGVNGDRPVYLRDVAEIRLGPEQPSQYVWFGAGSGFDNPNVSGEHPAVTIAVAKKPGTNAVVIADQVIERFEELVGTFVPEGVHATITRNYGKTANDKAMTLIAKLVFATTAVVLLVLFTLGLREAFIVGLAVVITLAITLFASWAWGFTLNRVSLFALIFSIGILVDDAIVVMENIHRHKIIGKLPLAEAIPLAVDEVGGPTILATLAVIAALLPMAFVTGLMGPYMSPIPINASIGMLISLAVAFVVTPWLANRLSQNDKPHEAEPGEDRLYRFFSKGMKPFLNSSKGRRNRWLLLFVVVGLILISISLAGTKFVVLKMLPFDNKSEFQVVVDLPEGTALERTAQVLGELGQYLSQVPEVTDYQVYAGTASPINFNGLVRQYYLRNESHQGDIQVNLKEKKKRDRKSHDIAISVREPLQLIGARYNANVKIVEVPPGPPVLSPLVAEIYGLDYNGQIAVAADVRKVLESTADIVDIDDTVTAQAPRKILRVDRQRAAHLGVSQAQVVALAQAALGGTDATYLRTGFEKYPIPVRLRLPISEKADLNQVLDMKLRSKNGSLVPVSELVTVVDTLVEQPRYHKDLQPVVYVTADAAGELDSPLYGMFDAMLAIPKAAPTLTELDQFLINSPKNPYQYSLKWDGEWQVTYETFRDMGIAYSVGLILIYLLVVAQFRSYLIPLIIMAPIPLTLIGVMPGHALMDKQFTATSMIGMIALAGIIVRNSILLVDFIHDQLVAGSGFEEAVIRAGAVRARPILLTALAAMLGAMFILDDPIFSGLAVSLIFGILVSTLLTLVVIPILYYALMANRQLAAGQ